LHLPSSYIKAKLPYVLHVRVHVPNSLFQAVHE
jgi:hypothetical protein